VRRRGVDSEDTAGIAVGPELGRWEAVQVNDIVVVFTVPVETRKAWRDLVETSHVPDGKHAGRNMRSDANV
jgi:hypothetical protein